MKSLTSIEYRSVSDLNRSIVDNLGRVPQGVDLIVGIPRSGLLAASLVALHLNLPLADLDGFLGGRTLGGGQKLQWSKAKSGPGCWSQALVLDDSVNTGAAMREVKERIAQSGIRVPAIYGCVYLNPAAGGEVDFHCETCRVPRIFEWNIMHDPILRAACVDIDGVLCRDPTEEENDDGPKYTEFISQVQPLIVPSVEMGHLVTCRLEKYRGPTEQWLARHGFQYGKLVMMDLPDKAARLSADNHADFKAAFYHQCNSCLFIESSLWQARTIVGRTGKSVFCAETREMLAPGVTSKSRRLALKIVPYLWRRIKSAAGQR